MVPPQFCTGDIFYIEYKSALALPFFDWHLNPHSYLYWQCHRRFALPLPVRVESLLIRPLASKIRGGGGSLCSGFFCCSSTVAPFFALSHLSLYHSVVETSLWKVLRKVATWKSMPTSDIGLTRIQYQWEDFSSVSSEPNDIKRKGKKPIIFQTTQCAYQIAVFVQKCIPAYKCIGHSKHQYNLVKLWIQLETMFWWIIST